VSYFNGAAPIFPTGVSAIFIFTAAYKNYKSSPSIIVTQSIIPVNSIVCVCDGECLCVRRENPWRNHVLETIVVVVISGIVSRDKYSFYEPKNINSTFCMSAYGFQKVWLSFCEEYSN
jgi:hypothetical protein